MNQLFSSGGQSIGASALASILPMNIQSWFPLGLTGLISLQSKRLSRVFSSTTFQKPSILPHSAFFLVQLSHLYVTTRKTRALMRQIFFFGKVMSVFFNTLLRFVRAFLPRSRHLLISWLDSLSTVIFGAQENKISHCFYLFPFYLPWSDESALVNGWLERICSGDNTLWAGIIFLSFVPLVLSIAPGTGQMWNNDWLGVWISKYSDYVISTLCGQLWELLHVSKKMGL